MAQNKHSWSSTVKSWKRGYNVPLFFTLCYTIELKFAKHRWSEQRKHGVVSASLGNHAQGLSYHGMKLNIPVTVVMPKEAPIMKIQKCRSFGAKVLVQGKVTPKKQVMWRNSILKIGEDMAAAKTIAMEISRDQKLPYVNGYDHPLIMSGQGM